MKKFYLLYGGMWLVALGAVFQFSAMARDASKSSTTPYLSSYADGQILKIEGDDYFVSVSGEENLVVRTELNEFFVHDDYRAGDRVSLYVSESEEGGKTYDIADYYHLDGLLFGFIIFCALALLIGRKRGFYSIVSVLLSLFFFYAIMLGAIKAGFPIIPAGLIFVFLVTVLTIPLIHGFNKKSASAILAVNAGYLIGFALTYFFTAIAKIGDTPSEDFRTLFIQFPEVDIRQILMVSLFLGAVGALIDVAISICSAVFEALEHHAQMTFSRAYTLGMNVGKDIMGSMINTLLIAYVAGSFPFLALLTLGNFKGIHEFLNFDFIALELTRIFIGAASIILLIPITSVVAAYLVARRFSLSRS